MATKTRQLADFLLEGGVQDIAVQQNPHIQPGTLQPAVAGKLLDGSTSHSGAYGTAQSDGHSYYYTDIKGSKPIKDPRIGAYFGSQRHMFKSIQLLEQETATQGKNVYSIDGREWMRAYTTSTKNFVMENGSHGELLLGADNCAGVTLEIVGFFNNFNMISRTAANHCDDIGVTVNGGTERDSADTGKLFGDSTVTSPIDARYVSCGSVINHGDSNLTTDLGTTPKINTIKITAKTGGSEYIYTYGIELIAQDTTSTTTKSQIQIPAQNVVSYGKKFTVSGTPHYNPFAFKTDGTTAWASGAHNGTSWPVGTGSSANIDTATSLGLSAWVSTNYYKPYNGGRVVWWVDSSGTLKCSVNMMPPNARNISSTASNEKGDDSAGTTSAAVANTQPLPTFTDQAIDQSQAEVAKTFHWREFGNGAANGGTGATYADGSMLTTTSDDISYVMDDGLTSFSGEDVKNGHADAQELYPVGVDDFYIITFIGTGITIKSNYYPTSGPPTTTIAQNLPYGTHILKVLRTSADGEADPTFIIDGVTLSDIDLSNYGDIYEVSFHQPKMPPIPEDAVVIADYMLMADFVPQTAHTEGIISKGTRRVSASRDFFYDHAHSSAVRSRNISEHLNYSTIGPYTYLGNQAGASTQQLPFFGTSWTYRYMSLSNYIVTGGTTFTINGSNLSSYTLDADGGGGTSITSAGVLTKIDATDKDNYVSAVGGTLGVSVWKQTETTASGKYTYGGDLDVATPIHTSHHYQPFESPYLYDLVGGDRNMEQTNLVVTSDGKTWDEVTRDTSYIGKIRVFCTMDGGDSGGQITVKFDLFRGSSTATGPYYQKDFAIAYDRLICLRDGEYRIFGQMHAKADSNDHFWFMNIGGTRIGQATAGTSNSTRPFGTEQVVMQYLKRGDTVQFEGYMFEGSSTYNSPRLFIDRV